MKLSVIIPVYNGEKYLRTLLNSFDFSDSRIEFIIVNDGSTDNTLNILNEYGNKAVIYDISNGGVSKARNYGLHKATGDYVTFVDADDSIPEDAFSYYLELLQKYCNVDCIQGGITFSNSEKCHFIDSKILIELCLGYPRAVYRNDTLIT